MEKLPSYSQEAVVAEVAADANLFPFRALVTAAFSLELASKW